jgi:hypothetical protein
MQRIPKGVAMLNAHSLTASHCVKKTGFFVVLGIMVIVGAGTFYQFSVAHNEVAKLQKTLGEADRVEVYSEGVGGLPPVVEERRLYASSRPEDLAALKVSIRIEEPVHWFVTPCVPSTIIRLFRGSKIIGELGLICGDIVRFSQWEYETQITNPEPLFEWLDSRGITVPRHQYDAEIAQGKQNRADKERWMKAMPSSIAQVWPNFHPDEIYRGDIRPLEAAVAKEFPDKRARILRLMAWYGSGAGPWSGFPDYEVVPEQMLLKYPTQELVDAVTNATLSEQETEGAARLFGSWEFNKSRSQDNALLPVDLKRKLLEHSLKSTDGDKLERAKYAFAANDSTNNR